MIRTRRNQAYRHAPAGPALRGRLLKALRVALAVLLLSVPLAAAAWVGMRLADPGTLPIRTVSVHGKFRYLRREAVRRAISAHIRGGLLYVNVDAVRRAVQALAWVSAVSVRRVWPDALSVSVQEQQPFAAWAGGGLVNTAGERFAAPAGSGPEGLPVFAGPSGEAPVMSAGYRRFSEILAPAGLHIRRLVLDQRHAWRIRLVSGLTLEVGREDVEHRLQRFAGVYRTTLAKEQTAIERVDLRYANGFAVKFADTDATAARTRGAIKKGGAGNAEKA